MSTINIEEDAHRLHVHYNQNTGHGEKPEQICIATHVLRPGSQVSMHMHNGACVRCPSGHCHEPNITAVMTEAGELMLTFENFPPPLHVEANDRGEAPRVISREDVITVDEEEFEAAVEKDLHTFQIMRAAWQTVSEDFRKEVYVVRADECPNQQDLFGTARAARPDVAVMKWLADSLSLDLGDLCDRVRITSRFKDGEDVGPAFAVFYDVTDLVREVGDGRVS
jgi:hypothetical protein